MKKTKEEGITLIALVVTIIVLLILAGITISMILGQQGIFNKTGQAKNETEIAQEKEAIKLAMTTIKTEKWEEKIQRNNPISDSELKEQLKKDGNTVEVTGGTGTLTVTYPTKRSYKVEQNGTITLIDDENNNEQVAPQPETGGANFSRTNGKVDLVFLQGDSYEVGQANAPKIENQNMVPVNYNGTNWVVTDEAGWQYTYDETNKKWANVMLRDLLEVSGVADAKTATIDEMKGKTVTNEGSMFVWIPRYAYKISYYADSDTSKTGDVLGYSDARGFVDKNGKRPSDITSAAVTSVAVGDNYRPHPAFETDLTQGGWSKKLTGMWIGKFNTSEVIDQDNFKVSVKAGYKLFNDLQNASIQSCYAAGKDLGVNGSHMLKNSEWGAIEYLVESKYGLNGQDIPSNDETIIVGYDYLHDNTQSSTKNIYGIYDLGSWTYTASYIANEQQTRYGLNFSSNDSVSNNHKESELYATVYNYDTAEIKEPEWNQEVWSMWQNKNYATNINQKFGDGIFEVSNTATGISWHQKAENENGFPVFSNAYFMRQGLSHFSFGEGDSMQDVTCRLGISI